MTHSFLMEAGRWTMEGYWLERDRKPIPVKGKTIVSWQQDNWFTIVSKLVFPQNELQEISFQYRGRLDFETQSYTYVLRQSILGPIEGEGSINLNSIVQRYIVLEDRQRRSGFETFYRLNDSTYYLTGGILKGHYLNSTMEATITRHI